MNFSVAYVTAEWAHRHVPTIVPGLSRNVVSWFETIVSDVPYLGRYVIHQFRFSYRTLGEK